MAVGICTLSVIVADGSHSAGHDGLWFLLRFVVV
jgi:hypothetical protein